VAVARAGMWVIRRVLTGEVDVAGRALGDLSDRVQNPV
jgi:hypothetical protein